MPQPAELLNPARPEARVSILLCTCNGHSYLQEQLASLRTQTHRDWVLHASDDCSTDDTVELLRHFGATFNDGRLHLRAGPGRGFAANFLSLACDATIHADYFAFCDQDDIWYPDKLERALHWLRIQPAETPALYCSRTELVDKQNRPLGFSPLFRQPPGFHNALVENIGGGNTMVFNEAARRLLMSAGADTPVVTHDWWTYLLVTGCGGTVFYDPMPSLRYRQHGRNAVGTRGGMADHWYRLKQVLTGRFSRWIDINLAALLRVEKNLTPSCQKMSDKLRQARSKPLLPRVLDVIESGVRRQSALGNVALLVAALLGKI